MLRNYVSDAKMYEKQQRRNEQRKNKDSGAEARPSEHTFCQTSPVRRGGPYAPTAGEENSFFTNGECSRTLHPVSSPLPEAHSQAVHPGPGGKALVPISASSHY